MAYISLLLHLLFFPQLAQQPEDGAIIFFKENTIKLGEIYAEERYERVFTFTNTGNAPLVIEDIETSCGCTVVKFSKEPILPGKTGEVKVDYIPKKGTEGFISKSVTVKSNAKNGTVSLFFHGTVVKKAKKKDK